MLIMITMKIMIMSIDAIRPRQLSIWGVYSLHPSTVQRSKCVKLPREAKINYYNQLDAKHFLCEELNHKQLINDCLFFYPI